MTIAAGAAMCATLVLAPAAQADEPVGDPLLNPLPDPTLTTLAIEVEELVQLPESSPTPEPTDERLIRHNRITHLDEVPDDSGRLMVVDMNEILYLVDRDTGEYVDYLNVRDHFADNFHNHAGLGTGFGFAEFHPDFADNGIFYTVHTEGGTALTEDEPDFPEYGGTAFHSVITEWTADDPSAETFSGTSRELMRIPFAGRVHTVQQIAFNPTVEPGDPDHGMLYILVGDGGNGVDNGNPQDLATPQGTIFRIDPLGEDSANGEYGIPADNPFVGTEGALEEIYAVGMRDPHRISWDTAGEHAMYLGHIGEWQVESIYEVESGDNFGWSEREGSFLAHDRQIYPLPDDDAGYTYPVAAYDHNRDPGQTGDAGVAVNGGFVYRGSIPELQGRYLFTDLVRGWILSTNADEMHRNDGDPHDLAPIEELRVIHEGVETTFAELVGDTRVDLRFGADASGELYLVSKADGRIWSVTGAHEVPETNVLPELARNVVSHYTFDHPVADAPAWEDDLGRSGTDIELVNGGELMRVADAAYPGAGLALQTQQLSPDTASNDDWKAGVYDPEGVDSLDALADAGQISIMGWFKPTGDHPVPNSESTDPDDVFNAIGLAGVLSGDSDGHGVRALLEVIEVDGELRLVALGRRVDGAGSWTYAATMPWDEILARNEWVHLAATFDYEAGEMRLFMNGEELEGEYTADNPWGEGTTSGTNPAGIKIGGSFPQNDRERNAFDGRMDDIVILDAVPTPEQIAAQYAAYGAEPVDPPSTPECTFDTEVTGLMAEENWTPRTPEIWDFPGDMITMTGPGTDPGDGIRRPFEYALLAAGDPVGTVQVEAEVRLDAPPSVNNRDIILVFGQRSDTEYYYAHLSQDNTIYAHNGIFLVDGADRLRIDDQWDEEASVGAPPAITDDAWHDVRLVHCAETGEIAVWVDGLDDPLMTATDTTFGSGRVGFGSFDNTGSMRDLVVSTQSDDEEPPVEPEPVPPSAGRGFYLNDGWGIWADHEFSFGRPGDEVLVGDWDGDGSDTLAVRRGNAYYLSNSLYGGAAEVELTYGRASDSVLVGDWDGDGSDSFAVRRGNSYFLTNSLTGGNADAELDYGRADDTVLVGDYDGDAVDTFTVRRGNTYYVSNSLSTGWADSELDYGRAGDQVLVGDWDGDAVDTFAVRRGNLYLVSNSLTSTVADTEVRYGRAGDEVFVGDWNGDGSDTLGVRR
ncbi:PQQ-dependent sugar dehydrogenase [Georgenia sp. Z1491]|uniref:PQQ-dependent sugar dehydrogenase n=1 Tax=Georgenia sp. Z1491 TaxID=3416707 RepID=UPI003CF57F90